MMPVRGIQSAAWHPKRAQPRTGGDTSRWAASHLAAKSSDHHPGQQNRKAARHGTDSLFMEASSCVAGEARVLEGHAFVAEAAVSVGGRDIKPGINVYRFANRIPLLFEVCFSTFNARSPFGRSALAGCVAAWHLSGSREFQAWTWCAQPSNNTL